MTFVFIMSLFLAPSFSYASYSEYNSNPNWIAVNNQGGSTPIIVTNAANNITLSSATLNGFVDGNNLYTAVWFEWSANSILNNPTKYNYGFGQSNYSTIITGLNPGTTYYFRAVAKNAQGTSYGDTYSFSTAFLNTVSLSNSNANSTVLTAITHPATSISSNSADLNALVIGINNNPANSYFEWGTTADLGNKTVLVSTGALPAVKHQSTLHGLASNTTYYFRSVAESSAGRSAGTILNFTTLGENTYTATSSTNTSNTNVTNSSNAIIIPANADSIVPYLGATAIGAAINFFPHSVLSWLLLLILVLLFVLLLKHVRSSFSKPKASSH